MGQPRIARYVKTAYSSLTEKGQNNAEIKEFKRKVKRQSQVNVPKAKKNK